MTADRQLHSLFTTFAEISEVFDKYLLIGGLVLFFSLSAAPKRAKRSILWIMLLSLP
jgi:hypothetical protein